MKLGPHGRFSTDNEHHKRQHSRGFTLPEMLVTIAVVMIMAAAAVPMVQSTLAYLQLRSAVNSVTGAIQGTRYQAISSGYQFRVAFSAANRNYQVTSDPTGSGTFTNVDSAIPFTGSPLVNLSGDFSFQFSPSGKVALTSGTSPFVLSRSGKTGTITVSTYGNINVKYAQ
jgi:prepilin-type N-terminal cleavage/methylation domain-containing protein